jgi:hypothetical protein
MNFRMLGQFLIAFALGSVAGMVVPSWPGVCVALVIGTALRFGAVDLVTGRRKIRRDRHPFPHRLNSRGGCACNCERCTKETNGSTNPTTKEERMNLDIRLTFRGDRVVDLNAEQLRAIIHFSGNDDDGWTKLVETGEGWQLMVRETEPE